MSDLPAGWVETTIGDVVEPKVEQRTPLENEHFYYIDISSIDRTAKKIVNPQKLSGKDAPSRARQVVASGDVLVSMTRPNLNAVAMVSDDLDKQIASTGFDVLRAKGVDSRWLYYLVRTNDFVTAMSDLVQGALYPAVRPRDIRNFEIPLAPLDEQKRIAEKLDSLLTRVDSCQTHLERVPQILKRFRQSVLAAATSGRLTEDWREGKETNWETHPLGDLCSRVSVGHVGITSKYYTTAEEGIPFLRSQNVRPGRVDLSGLVYITREFHEKLKKSQLQAGDLLIVRVGANRGDTCVLPSGFAEVNCANIVFARPTKILPEYLGIYFQSPLVQEEMLGKAVGGAQEVVNTKMIEQINVLVPSPEEQAEIVRRVESLFAYAERLEARYLSASERVEGLTPSLLAKAFRGELVEQEAGDESADE